MQGVVAAMVDGGDVIDGEVSMRPLGTALASRIVKRTVLTVPFSGIKDQLALGCGGIVNRYTTQTRTTAGNSSGGEQCSVFGMRLHPGMRPCVHTLRMGRTPGRIFRVDFRRIGCVPGRIAGTTLLRMCKPPFFRRFTLSGQHAFMFFLGSKNGHAHLLSGVWGSEAPM